MRLKEVGWAKEHAQNVVEHVDTLLLANLA
jgi:hypothetical protein